MVLRENLRISIDRLVISHRVECSCTACREQTEVNFPLARAFIQNWREKLIKLSAPFDVSTLTISPNEIKERKSVEPDKRCSTARIPLEQIEAPRQPQSDSAESFRNGRKQSGVP